MEVDGTRGRATTTGALRASDDDQVWARDAACWIHDLPSDGQLRTTTSWSQSGLVQTRSDLTLNGLDDLTSQVLPLL